VLDLLVPITATFRSEAWHRKSREGARTNTPPLGEGWEKHVVSVPRRNQYAFQSISAALPSSCVDSQCLLDQTLVDRVSPDASDSSKDRCCPISCTISLSCFDDGSRSTSSCTCSCGIASSSSVGFFRRKFQLEGRAMLEASFSIRKLQMVHAVDLLH
jgi:hypothetical protein